MSESLRETWERYLRARPKRDLRETWERPERDLREIWARMMKIESSRQVWTEWTNKRTEIGLSWAPYGAKNRRVSETGKKGELCAISSLYKANGYDLPVAVSFTFLSRPRNVKCRGASAELSSQDTKIWSESRCLAHNDRQHSGFYVGKEFDNKKLQEHYDFWHQAS